MSIMKRVPYDFPWKELVVVAKRHQLDPLLVAAVCMQESAMNIWATRVEFSRVAGAFVSRWRYFKKTAEFARMAKTTEITEAVHQATSWGLMQVMGTVAREMGLAGPLPSLCEPFEGLEYGCRHLRAKIDLWGSIEAGLSAYNAGTPRKNGTLFKNQHYVDSVMDHFAKFESEKESENGKNSALWV